MHAHIMSKCVVKLWTNWKCRQNTATKFFF